jgi:hypothetical protein
MLVAMMVLLVEWLEFVSEMRMMMMGLGSFRLVGGAVVQLAGDTFDVFVPMTSLCRLMEVLLIVLISLFFALLSSFFVGALSIPKC